MASVLHTSPTRWVVHMASSADKDNEVTVELRMSRSVARRLAEAEAARAAALSPGRKDPPVGDVGSAVLGLLTSVTAIHRVKERIGALDQQEVMDLVDGEVAAARASRA